MSAAQQAPVALPMKKGVVKQVSRNRVENVETLVFWLLFHRVPTQHLNFNRNMIFHDVKSEIGLVQ